MLASRSFKFVECANNLTERSLFILITRNTMKNIISIVDCNRKLYCWTRIIHVYVSNQDAQNAFASFFISLHRQLYILNCQCSTARWSMLAWYRHAKFITIHMQIIILNIEVIAKRTNHKRMALWYITANFRDVLRFLL